MNTLNTRKQNSMMTMEMSLNAMKRHLVTVEKLRDQVQKVLKCVINLHIDILVIESNVAQLLDEVKDLNTDLLEVQRLDNLINTLRNYGGPTICHEWPYPLIYKGTIDNADLAQILNIQKRYSITNQTEDEMLANAKHLLT